MIHPGEAPAIITVAPTGPIAGIEDNPSLPTQPEQIAEEVACAYQAGAAVAHLHFRDRAHRPTADLEIARATIELIAERCPILIQISTGVGLGVALEQRAALVELRPQMATLNPCTMSFGNDEFRNPPPFVRRLAARMQELKVKPELEIYDTGHLDACLALFADGLLEPPLQFSLVLGVRGGMSATPENLVAMVNRLPADSVWQVIAIGRQNLRLSAIGLALGGNVRTGMEDALHLRRGEPVQSNLPLVRRTVQLVRALDRSPATVEQARAALALPA
jgi:3-keto-5-aminohexanoate cleavage enzyme